MDGLGLGPRDILALTREAQRGVGSVGPLVVIGVGADTLARRLAAGGEPTLVRTSGDPESAAALVVVCDGQAGAAETELMRRALRAGVPLVAVQLADGPIRLPYVLPTNVIQAQRGMPLPLERIFRVLAVAVGDADVGLAAAVPGLRAHARRGRVVEAAVAAGVLAAMRAGRGPRLPLISLLQARMLRSLDVATGVRREPDAGSMLRLVVPELAVSVGTGLAARRIARMLPLEGRAVDATIAAGATLGLGLAAARLRVAAVDESG